nr:hypothetical protein CFP56_63588 [Quercus suber]
MEDGGGQIGWFWGWSGVGWWSVAARSVTLSKRGNKIGVSRTSWVLGGSRTGSVLGGLILGGNNLDGSADELPARTMGVISPMLGRNLDGASGNAISLVLGCNETGAIWG